MDKYGQSKKIGLLGGSFNPAHEGHVYISKKAIELLGLDEVWWIVALQNPLKSKEEMSDFNNRFASAKKITANIDQIVISDFEKKAQTQYTYDTLKKLKSEYNNFKFVWLMGADNLVNFHKWHNWQEIFEMVPIAVFDREKLAKDAIESVAAKSFKSCRISAENSRDLAQQKSPKWCFLEIEKTPESSTEIRNNPAYKKD